jgi:hypothetical protein
MGDGRKGRSRGVFGEKGTRAGTGSGEPKMAGVFGAKKAPLRERDRKSPADKPVAFTPDEDDDDGEEAGR